MVAVEQKTDVFWFVGASKKRVFQYYFNKLFLIMSYLLTCLYVLVKIHGVSEVKIVVVNIGEAPWPEAGDLYAAQTSNFRLQTQ